MSAIVLFCCAGWGKVGLLPARGGGGRLWGGPALRVCHGSSFPKEVHFLRSKEAELKKEHGEFLAGGNRDLRHSCLGASIESQRLWLLAGTHQGEGGREIINPLLTPFLFCNPSPALTIFENTASRLLLQGFQNQSYLCRDLFCQPYFSLALSSPLTLIRTSLALLAWCFPLLLRTAKVTLLARWVFSALTV